MRGFLAGVGMKRGERGEGMKGALRWAFFFDERSVGSKVVSCRVDGWLIPSLYPACDIATRH